MRDTEPEDDFFEHLRRLAEATDEGGRLLADAEEVYAPAPASPDPAEKKVSGWLRWRHPERLVTVPVWVLGVTGAHLIIAAAAVLALAFGTAVLAVVGRAIDSVVGLPLATAGAVGVGLLASVGTLASVYRSYRERLRDFPW